MLFILGVIVGLLVAILIVATLTFFRRIIEHKINIVEKQVDIKGPRPKGYIVEATDDNDEIRDDVIAQNAARGQHTPISELQ